MKNYIILFIWGITFLRGYTQTTSINYRLNATDSLVTDNPFRPFIGEWTLKNDDWTQNWGNGTETIKIPGHHTISSQVNTANSLFSIIDGPEPNGHIFWSYNPVTKKINHLSSFGELRAGVGEGTISKDGDVTLKITFEGEPRDTYRLYSYQWTTQDEYHMKSVQYDFNDIPTGLFYEGTFVRLPHNPTDLEHQIETVLAVLDNNEISVEEQLDVYTDDIVHMAPGNEVIIGKEALESYLKQQRLYGEPKMQHRIVEMETFNDLVVMRGEVIGTFYPKNQAPSVAFRTKNLFVFVPSDGIFKIKKVIYNDSPLD